MGSLAYTPSGVNATLFTSANCQGSRGTFSLQYGLDFAFMENSSWINALNFTSFNISRPLEKQEQLDISSMGQDSGQAQVWNCGAYIMKYGVGTAADCYDLPNGESAGCMRLWHY